MSVSNSRHGKSRQGLSSPLLLFRPVWRLDPYLVGACRASLHVVIGDSAPPLIQQGGEAMELEKAKTIAEKIKAVLEPACERITIAGSIRRRKPYPNDIELLCIPKYIAGADMLDAKIKTMIHFDMLGYRLNKLGSKVYGPKNKLLVHLPSGIGVDIFSTVDECWPVALVVRTGGERTNKEIASRAIERGMRFHAYGRGFTKADGSELVCHSEADVFRAVGVGYREPWERR